MLTDLTEAFPHITNIYALLAFMFLAIMILLGSLKINAIVKGTSLFFLACFILFMALKLVSDTTNTIGTSLDAAMEMSASWMNEPSGLSACGLTDTQNRWPLFVGVDDEESAVFILQANLDDQKGRVIIRNMIPLVKAEDENEGIANDLESITYDPDNNRYYALTSHRRFPKKSKSRRLLQFKISENEWSNPKYKIGVQNDHIVDLANISSSLQEYLSSNGIKINMENWSNKTNDKRQEFELEIEGLTYGNGLLYMGLKWPLEKGTDKALILLYDPVEKIFRGIEKVPLGGDGITALAYEKSHLLLVSNPTRKPVDESGNSLYYGKSKLWAFPIDESTKLPSIGGEQLPLTNFPETKLEGIAIDKKIVIMAYEGQYGRSNWDLLEKYFNPGNKNTGT